MKSTPSHALVLLDALNSTGTIRLKSPLGQILERTSRGYWDGTGQNLDSVVMRLGCCPLATTHPMDKRSLDEHDINRVWGLSMGCSLKVSVASCTLRNLPLQAQKQ